ncbi:MAG: EAL domain-containing protein [Thermoanaerobaculia bacterium]
MDRSLLETVLAPGGLRPLFQPVVDVSDAASVTIHYIECLMRGPVGTHLEPANVLFDYVRLKREESLVDRACVAAALHGLARLDDSVRMSVNVHASTLGRDHGFVGYFQEVAEAARIDIERVTLEIVEHAPPWDGVSFLAAIADLRSLGVAIALDDVGLGLSNYKMILDVCPDYLKVDRYFVSSCDEDPKRRAVIRSIRQLGSEFGARIVAEGVERREELETLRGLGVSLVQGFLFAEPSTHPEIPRSAHELLVREEEGGHGNVSLGAIRSKKKSDRRSRALPSSDVLGLRDR